MNICGAVYTAMATWGRDGEAAGTSVGTIFEGETMQGCGSNEAPHRNLTYGFYIYFS